MTGGRRIGSATTGDRRRGQPRLPMPFWGWCVLVPFIAVLYATSVPYLAAVYELDLVVAFGIATLQCASLIGAERWPRSAAAVHLLAIAALVLATRDSEAGVWPLPITGLVSLGALVLLLGLREHWIVPVTTWWVSVVLLVALVTLSPARYADPDQWGTNLTIYTSYTLLVLGGSIAVGQRHRFRAELALARRSVEEAHAQRLLAEERARIARELHDVVAHSMSLVHMQALSAPFRLRSTTPAVEREFDDIARSAGNALAEMRQVLGALRPEPAGAELSPQPQLDDLGELVAGAARAGVPVSLQVTEALGPVSPIAQLTAYRIVQEALSNVARHAPSAPTLVQVEAHGHALHVMIENEAGPGSDPATAVAPDRGGHGLAGMAERVALLGGALETGPTPTGGFVVDAVLPSAILELEESR